MKKIGIFLVFLISPAVFAKTVVHGSDRIMFVTSKEYKTSRKFSSYLPEIMAAPESEIESRLIPWKRVMSQAESGAIDIVGPMAVDPSRGKYLIYTEPLMSRDLLFWYKVDKFTFKKKNWNVLSDLKPYTIAYVLGYYYGDWFQEFLRNTDVKKIEVPDFASGVKALETGKTDLFIGSETTFYENLDKAGLKREMFAAFSKPLMKVSFVLGVSKKSSWAAKIDELNKRIIKIRKSIEPKQ